MPSFYTMINIRKDLGDISYPFED